MNLGKKFSLKLMQTPRLCRQGNSFPLYHSDEAEKKKTHLALINRVKNKIAKTRLFIALPAFPHTFNSVLGTLVVMEITSSLFILMLCFSLSLLFPFLESQTSLLPQ